MPLVTLDIRDAVATVTLRRSDKLNSLNSQMIGELGDALDAGSRQARVVVLRAEPGVAVFSAGHDLDDVPIHADPHEWDNPVEAVIAGIPALDVPVIAAVEGTVWGAACNLVVACDLIVATRNATFAITPAKLGVPYFRAGLSIFARSLPLHVAKAMFYTAEPITADQAHGFGLVHSVAEDTSELDAQVARLAGRIASLAPLTIRSVKAELDALDGLTDVDEGQLRELAERAWRSDDVKEGVAAFRERRRPRFSGR
ncbi:MAG: enoyl-CoA hydratase/isomerase family protein [Actinobacteria bacterium]|nr:enoyl-CoA hydratase/isomerase family protein [Actinomycetota bacterium]